MGSHRNDPRIGFNYGDRRSDGQYSQHPALAKPQADSSNFVQPLRYVYMHKSCQNKTLMGWDLARTWATDPGFYPKTFCIQCGNYFPVEEFVWCDCYGEVIRPEQSLKHIPEPTPQLLDTETF